MGGAQYAVCLLLDFVWGNNSTCDSRLLSTCLDPKILNEESLIWIIILAELMCGPDFFYIYLITFYNVRNSVSLGGQFQIVGEVLQNTKYI